MINLIFIQFILLKSATITVYCLQKQYLKDINSHHMYRIRLRIDSTREDFLEWNKKFDKFLQISFKQPYSFGSPLKYCPEVLVFIIPNRTQISGVLMAQYRDKNKNLDDNFYICFLSVLPEYRKFGLASTLLNAIIQEAYDTDVQKVSLNVNIKNGEALRLYRKCGFLCSKYESNFYPPSQYDESDAYYMTLLTKYIRVPSLVCKTTQALVIPTEMKTASTAVCVKRTVVTINKFH